MVLGEKLNKGHATRLWGCTAILDSSHPIPAGLGANWPRDLVHFMPFSSTAPHVVLSVVVYAAVAAG